MLIFQGGEFVDGIGDGPGATPEWEAGAALARRAEQRRQELERKHGPVTAQHTWTRAGDRLTLRSDYFGGAHRGIVHVPGK
jgi:hypothetical protein